MTAEDRKKEIILNTGEGVKYDALHSRLRRTFGKAKECVFCFSKTCKRYEWAVKKGRTYSLNIDDYFSLCPSCHRKYDETEERRNKISKSLKGKNVLGKNPAAKKVIDTITGFIYNTVTEAAISLSIKRTTLVMMLNGKNKNRTNLKYYES